jgi:hypothetical protein
MGTRMQLSCFHRRQNAPARRQGWGGCVFALAWIAFPALAATELETARALAASAREEVMALQTQQVKLRQALHLASNEVQALKSRNARGASLQQALQRSQTLSAELTQVSKGLAHARTQADGQVRSWLESVSAAHSQLRSKLERTQDSTQRKALFLQLRALREEREQARALLPASAVAAGLPPTNEADADELLEQADALRDRDDKLRRELSALEQRMGELKEERDLDRRMGDFLGESALFDENDRRLRLGSTRVTERAPSLQPSGNGAPPRGEVALDAMGNPPPAGGPANPMAPSLPTPNFSADARPDLGAVRPPGLGPNWNDFASLEKERQRLQKLSDELKARAQALEQQAAQTDR